MGPVQKAMGRTLFCYCFKAWGVYVFCSLQPRVGYFFPLPWSQWEDIYRKNAVAAIFFNEIADSDWNAVAPIEVNWKRNLTPRAASTANTMSHNIFWRQYLWKEYHLPQYKICCLIVWGKMIECHGARTFFFLLSVMGRMLFFIVLFCHVALFVFIRQFTFAPAPCPNK